MAKAIIDDRVAGLAALDPKAVADMLSKSTTSFINQLAEAEGVKPYVIKAIIMGATKMAELRIAKKKEEGKEEEKEEEKEDNSKIRIETLEEARAIDNSTDINLAGDLMEGAS